MSEGAWLTVTIGSAAVVAIVLVGYVLHALQTQRAGDGAAARSAWTRATPPTGRRRRGGLWWSTGPRRRRTRSVEDNLARAFERIDAVDPHVGQRRIGDALAQVGLISSPSVFDDPPLTAPAGSAAVTPGPSRGWEDEA